MALVYVAISRVCLLSSFLRLYFQVPPLLRCFPPATFEFCTRCYGVLLSREGGFRVSHKIRHGPGAKECMCRVCVRMKCLEIRQERHDVAGEKRVRTCTVLRQTSIVLAWGQHRVDGRQCFRAQPCRGRLIPSCRGPFRLFENPAVKPLLCYANQVPLRAFCRAFFRHPMSSHVKACRQALHSRFDSVRGSISPDFGIKHQSEQ